MAKAKKNQTPHELQRSLQRESPAMGLTLKMMSKKGMLNGPDWRAIIADMLQSHVGMILTWAERIPEVRNVMEPDINGEVLATLLDHDKAVKEATKPD